MKHKVNLLTSQHFLGMIPTARFLLRFSRQTSSVLKKDAINYLKAFFFVLRAIGVLHKVLLKLYRTPPLSAFLIIL